MDARLRGIARLGKDRVVARIVLKDESGELGRVVHLEPFDIEQEDGTRVTIELGQDTALLPLERKQGSWSSFEDDALLAPLRKAAPGPHVDVVVERAVIADGMRVVVRGEEHEHAFDAPQGIRSAPQRRVTRVSAIAIATGANAEEMVGRALAPAAPKVSRNAGVPEGLPSRPLGDIVTAARISLVMAAVVALASRTVPVSPWKLDLEVSAMTFVALATWFAYVARVPYFTTHGAKLEDHHPRTFRNVALLAGGVLIFISSFGWGFDLKVAIGNDAKSPQNASPLVIAACISYLALLGGLLVHWTRKTASIVRALASAPALPAGAAEATWGGVLGTVRDPTPTGFSGEETAVEHVVQRKVQRGSDPDIVTESIVNADTFFVDTDDGRTYEIVPWDATWASAVRAVDVDSPMEERYRYVVVIGGRVWVVGRADRAAKGAPPRFEAAGPESLLFYATPSTADPRAKIRRLARMRLAVFVVMLGCAGGMVARAVQLDRQLPAFHLEGEGSM
jgi:hypothetical protein